jgi:ABC-type antimicrobial peptide transport system permease subunit
MSGLAIGMAVAMLVGLWLYDELSFNKYHQNYDRIGQIMQSQVMHGEKGVSRSLPVPFVQELKANFSSHFKHTVASTQTDEFIVAAGNTKLSRKGRFMEAAAAEMLTLKMQKGSWSGLQDPQSVFLSESTAKALFGNTDPINKPVKVDTDMQLKVTGIFKDFPQNTEFREVQFLGSWDYFLEHNRYMKQKLWDNHAILVYVELQPNTTFEKATANILDSELNAIKKLESMQHEVATNPKMWINPMSNWHLYSDFRNGEAGSGPVQYVRLVGIIGFFVLLLACINFINLSTARSGKRAKEVGVRKAVGSLRWQLMSQFFGESFLIVLISFGFALIILLMSLPWFNELAAKQMVIPWQNAYFWAFNIAFVLFTALLAGCYPALYLTSFQPVKVLKSSGQAVTMHFGRFAYLPRQVLVTLQFTISIALIICTIIIYKQIQFAKNRPVGYSRDGLVMVAMKNGEFYDKADLLRNELKSTGAVSEIALSQSPVTDVWSANNGFTWKGMPAGFTESFATLTVSPEYAATVDWKFIAGRNFSKSLASDSSGFIINKSAARLLGMENPLGQVISWKSQWMTDNIEKQFTVIGVVEDMVMESPFEQVKPTVFFLFGSPNWINIRLNPALSTVSALQKIESVFKRIVSSAPFEYQFADQAYDAKFRAEERIGKLAGFFAVLAILISCLGLFGLASFVAEQRTKEIAIRKVLGASVAGVWQMLSKDFVWLVMISACIAALIAFYAMKTWLQHYEYRTPVSWWIFLFTAMGALIIALITVSYQGLKAALMNPVKSLKSE